MKIKRVLSAPIFLIISFFIIACEDDPLLSPQVPSDDAGGSYGDVVLPGDDERKNFLDNPEIF